MKSAILLIALFLFAGNLSAQIDDSKRVARVPKENREKLKERVGQYVECYKTQNWGCIYDLLYQISSTREEFIKQDHSFFGADQVAEFNPTVRGVYIDKPDAVDSWYSMIACVKFKRGNNNYRYSFNAYLIKNDWRFSQIIPTDFIELTEQTPCQMSDYDAPLIQKN